MTPQSFLSASSQQTKPLALVVDDEALVRMTTCDILEEAGYDIVEAETADEALGLLDRLGDHLWLVVTDVRMPGRLDGISLAARAHERWPGVRLVVVSGNGEAERDDRLPRSAVFLGKPFTAAACIRAIQQADAMVAG
jgi:two-component system, response regulator PdtaR